MTSEALPMLKMTSLSSSLETSLSVVQITLSSRKALIDKVPVLQVLRHSLITTVIVSQSVAVSFKVALSSALKATIALLIIVVVATVVVVLLRVVVVVVVGWQAGFYSPWSHGQPLLQLLHLGGQGPS
ncbi:hypothetical protein Tco_1090723 [Tanacetum coccineum]|uniref:Transmembrane protein n=1 Tax=Tanacetum coccineum TaxID=301880 RepID=A0ABQ5I6C7_9ASTR